MTVAIREDFCDQALRLRGDWPLSSPRGKVWPDEEDYLRHEYESFPGGFRRSVGLVGMRGSEVEKATADTDVLENIRAAPIAYMKFFSKIALLLFVFSLAFYFVFNTILVNPIFAVVGALTSIFSWLLASISGRL